jgi:predicted YcjX-like family ATPase
MQEPIWSLDLYLPLNNAPGTSFADLANALRIDFEYFEDSHQLWLSSLIAPNIVALIASQHMPIEWRFAD